MNEPARKAMLACNKNCRVNVMHSVNHVYLCWVGSLSHTEVIDKPDYDVDNDNFKLALERARKALLDCDITKKLASEYEWNGSVLAYN